MLVLFSSLMFVSAFLVAAVVIAHSLTRNGARVIAVLRSGGTVHTSQPLPAGRRAVRRVVLVSPELRHPPLRAAA